MGRLVDKVALVTGAGQGVGQGIAYALAAEGATVAVSGRTRSKLDKTVAEIEKRGGRALAVECDVKNREAIERCVATVVDQLGGLHILVNNAQEAQLAPLLQLTDEGFALGWESGPLATLRFMRCCYPHLKGGGSIVNVASAAVKRWDQSNYGGYSGAKEAIRQLTRAAACEWARHGIRSNVILPWALSPGQDRWVRENPEAAAAVMAEVPMQRMGDCEGDVGRFVATLCSDDCRYVNGQSIGLDGGWAFLG